MFAGSLTCNYTVIGGQCVKGLFSLEDVPWAPGDGDSFSLASSAARLNHLLMNVSKANPPHLSIAKQFAEACAKCL